MSADPKPKLTDAMRAYLTAAGRKGGKKGRGDAKRKGALAYHARRRALKEAHAELVAVSREIGAFLDELNTLVGETEERRKDLCDRLYSVLQATKVKVAK